MRKPTRTITYKAPPTAIRFHKSKAFIRGIRGPIGSGKTSSCINEMHRLAVAQAPNSEGIRLTRMAVVRNTYMELKNTSLATFNEWIPSNVCEVTEYPQIRAKIRYPLPDGTKVQCDVLFLPLDSPEDVRKVLSLDLTGAFINEAREVPYEIVTGIRARLGRYPSVISGYSDTDDYKGPRGMDGDYQPCTRKFLVMDTNSPSDRHWWAQLDLHGKLTTENGEEQDVGDQFEFFSVPPPLIKTKSGEYKENKKAENLKNLPSGIKYYTDLIPGNSEDYIRVMVLNEYGSIRQGHPVYTQYNDVLHCAKEPLQVNSSLPIGLAFDAGLSPACVIGQLTKKGQLRVLAELTAKRMQMRTFARDIVKPFLAKHFDGIDIAFSVIDPSANRIGEGEGGSAKAVLNDTNMAHDKDVIIAKPLHMGFTTRLAPSNDITKRLDAVNIFLSKLVDGKPGFVLSPVCKTLRQGFIGGYYYKRKQKNWVEQVEKPLKNEYSHSHDALQYLCLVFVNGFVEKYYNKSNEALSFGVGAGRSDRWY